jgi:hypothetical protein
MLVGISRFSGGRPGRNSNCLPGFFADGTNVGSSISTFIGFLPDCVTQHGYSYRIEGGGRLSLTEIVRVRVGTVKVCLNTAVVRLAKKYESRNKVDEV